jgi:hypothetical protein
MASAKIIKQGKSIQESYYLRYVHPEGGSAFMFPCDEKSQPMMTAEYAKGLLRAQEGGYVLEGTIKFSEENTVRDYNVAKCACGEILELVHPVTVCPKCSYSYDRDGHRAKLLAK